jgi:hypothetical protein
MSSSRSRFSGDASALAACIEPFATVPDFLLYDDKLDCPFAVEKIEAVAPLWQKVFELHPQLTFTQKQLTEALGIVHNAKHGSWKRQLNKDELKEWKEIMGKRFRAQARALSQGIFKSNLWATKIVYGGSSTGKRAFAPDDGEFPEEQDDDEAPLVPTAMKAMKAMKAMSAMKAMKKKAKLGDNDFTMGWDGEHQSAWRLKGESTMKEWAVKVISDRGSNDHPVAVFADGTEAEIETLTCAELALEKLVHGRCKGKLWSSESGDVWITHRKDRTPILCLYEKTGGESAKQICQITIKHFGNPDEEVPQRTASHPPSFC